MTLISRHGVLMETVIIVEAILYTDFPACNQCHFTTNHSENCQAHIFPKQRSIILYSLGEKYIHNLVLTMFAYTHTHTIDVSVYMISSIRVYLHGKELSLYTVLLHQFLWLATWEALVILVGWLAGTVCVVCSDIIRGVTHNRCHLVNIGHHWMSWKIHTQAMQSSHGVSLSTLDFMTETS